MPATVIPFSPFLPLGPAAQDMTTTEGEKNPFNNRCPFRPRICWISFPPSCSLFPPPSPPTQRRLEKENWLFHAVITRKHRVLSRARPRLPLPLFPSLPPPPPPFPFSVTGRIDKLGTGATTFPPFPHVLKVLGTHHVARGVTLEAVVRPTAPLSHLLPPPS